MAIFHCYVSLPEGRWFIDDWPRKTLGHLYSDRLVLLMLAFTWDRRGTTSHKILGKSQAEEWEGMGHSIIYRIWWVFKGFCGICCSFMGFCGIWWGFMGFHGISRDLMGFNDDLIGLNWISWDLMGFDDDLPLVIQHSYGIDGPVVDYLLLKNDDFP